MAYQPSERDICLDVQNKSGRKEGLTLVAGNCRRKGTDRGDVFPLPDGGPDPYTNVCTSRRSLEITWS